MSSTVEKINMFLNAFPDTDVRGALRERALKKREDRKTNGWEIWHGEGTPPQPHEWTRINGVTYYRDPPAYNTKPKSDAMAYKPACTPDKLRCPYCGEDMFPQSVCPNCQKGKAGLKTQWVCGNNSDHVFYTEE